MRSLKWILVLMGGAVLLVGCANTTNGGLSPTQATYTQATGSSPVVFPSTLVLFNGYLATGLNLNVYEYAPPPGLTDATAVVQTDTSVMPQSGKANLMTGLTSYQETTWVGFPILSTGAIGTVTNYSELTFYVKAAFAAAVAPALPVTTGIVTFNSFATSPVTVTVTPNWQKVIMPVTGSFSGPADSELFCVNFYAAMIAAPVTAYIDQVQFQ